MKQLKLFYFDPNTWGQEYSVMAFTEHEAVEYIKQHLMTEAKKELEAHNKCSWLDKTTIEETFSHEALQGFPQKYTVTIFEEGQVLNTEIS